MSRPEHIAPPEIYYGFDESKKYAQKYATLAQVIYFVKASASG
jgi:hypothetical protein